MVKIRLTRMGRHKSPYYRIVVTDSRKRRDADYIALIGNYEPFSGKTTVNSELAMEWLNKGAQPTDTAKSILKKDGVWSKFMNQKQTSKKASSTKKTSKK